MNLVLLACLTSAPTECREISLLISTSPVAAMSCMAGAPVTIAEWMGDHPELQVSRWWCEAPGRSAGR